VLGSKTMRQVGAHVGATVRVALAGSSSGGGESRVRIYRVVGTTVPPADFNSQGLGTGAVFTLDGLLGRSCPVGTGAQGCLVTSVLAQDGVFIVRTAPVSQGAAALASPSQACPSQVNYPRPPTDLVHFGEAVNSRSSSGSSSSSSEWRRCSTCSCPA